MLPEAGLASVVAFLPWVNLAYSPGSSWGPAPLASHPNKNLQIKFSLLQLRGVLEKARISNILQTDLIELRKVNALWAVGPFDFRVDTEDNSNFILLPVIPEQLSCALTHSSGAGMNHHWCPKAAL